MQAEHEITLGFNLGATLVVATDGSGTHRRLADAVAAAGVGATIALRRGSHRLEEGLVLPRAVTLLGESMENTEIVAGRGPCVIRYEGDGPFTLLDIAVRWDGPREQLVDVVRVARGSILIARSCFGGSSQGEGANGCGLELDGPVHGTISRCVIDGNGHGMVIAATAEPSLQENICRNNSSSGIFYCGAAGGIASGNRCTANGTHGIHVSQQARPRLLGNTCADNGLVGIAYLGRGGGTAHGNTCTGNRCHGIGVTDEGEPLLEQNECRANVVNGIYYNESGAGAARHNECRDNGRHGIAIEEQAHPSLLENTCAGNTLPGIAVAPNARPTLWNNRTPPGTSGGQAVL